MLFRDVLIKLRDGRYEAGFHGDCALQRDLETAAGFVYQDNATEMLFAKCQKHAEARHLTPQRARNLLVELYEDFSTLIDTRSREAE